MSTSHEVPLVSNDAQSPSARRAKWFGWWFYVTVMVLAPFALVLAGGLAFWLWWKWDEMQAAKDVKQEVARIQALGEPVTIYDLNNWHRVPEGTNDTTALWLNALTLTDSIPIRNTKFVDVPIVASSSSKRDTLSAEHPQSKLTLAEEFLIANDEAVQAVLAASAQRGQCRLPTNFAAGVAALSSTQRARGVARLMSLRMRVAIERDHPQAALESIEATLALAQAIDHEPTLVDHLLQLAVIGVALSDIEQLLKDGQLAEGEMARLQASVQQLEIQDAFTTALLGERGIGYHEFHQFPPGPRIATALQPMAGGKLARAADCRFYLELMQEYIDASRQPFPKSLQDSNQIAARVATVAQSTNPLERMRYVQSMEIVPGMEASFTASARAQALRNVTLAAIASERYRLKHGEFPAHLQSLGEFLGTVPIDPFDGQLLRMIRKDGELLLYSVGKDGRDDGGLDGQYNFEPDIVARLKSQSSVTPLGPRRTAPWE